MSLVSKLKQTIYPIYSQYLRRVVVTEGNLKNNKGSIRIMHFAEDRIKPYLDDNVYEEEPEVIANKVTLFSRLDKLIDQFQPHFVVTTLPPKWQHLSEPYNRYEVPYELQQIIDVSGEWDDVKANMSRSRKTFANQVEKKYKLTHRLSNDVKEFDHYYHQMHLPYIESRFNSEYLDVYPYDEQKSWFDNGFLIFIKHEDQDIAAALCVQEDDTLKYMNCGLLEGDHKYNRQKAQMAIYFYLIKVARDKKLKYMDAMYSMAFANDGVHQAKSRWGAGILKYDPPDEKTYFLIPKNSENAQIFFAENPVVYYEHENFYLLIGSVNKQEFTEDEKQKLKKTFHGKGIKGLSVLVDNNKYPLEF